MAEVGRARGGGLYWRYDPLGLPSLMPPCTAERICLDSH